MPLHQILNILYAEAIKRLDPEKPVEARRELDGRLGVHSWQNPLLRKVPQTPVDGPWWWRGDLDATDDFLAFAKSQGETLE